MVLLVAATGCARDYSPNTYSVAAVQQANKVDQGVIAGYREIEIKTDGTVGAVTGGAAGGVLGAQEPDGGVVTALSAIGGTLVGGLIGTGVEHATSDTKAFEYLVRKPNGDLLSLAQKDVTPLPVGLKVLVIEGKQARIVADYSVPPPAATHAAAKNDKTDGSKGEKSDTANAAKTDEAKTDDANKAVTIGTPSGAPTDAAATPAQAPQPPAATQPAAEPRAADSSTPAPSAASQTPAPQAPAPQADETSAAQAPPYSPATAQRPVPPVPASPPAKGDPSSGMY